MKLIIEIVGIINYCCFNAFESNFTFVVCKILKRTREEFYIKQKLYKLQLCLKIVQKKHNFLNMYNSYILHIISHQHTNKISHLSITCSNFIFSLQLQDALYDFTHEFNPPVKF